MRRNNKSDLAFLKRRLEDNGGKWLGFKLGKDDAIVARVRRAARKFFYLVVKEYYSEDKVLVGDGRRGERGIAIRFNNHSFVLEPGLENHKS